MPKHIIFDFFGTLVENSAQREERSFAKTLSALEQHGPKLSEQEFLTAWGQSFKKLEEQTTPTLDEFSMQEVLEDFCLKRGLKFKGEEAKESFIDLYLSEWTSAVRKIEGLNEMLLSLSKDFTLSILSNTHSTTMVPKLMKRFELEPYFHKIMTSVEIGKRKPSAEIFKFALKELNSDANDAIYVGDSVREDYLGPREIGLESYLIDPSEMQEVASGYRLKSILQLEAALR